MSQPQFRAETDALRAQAATLADLSAEMKNIVSSLQAKLAGEGAPWGGDEPGQRFSGPYLPARDKIDAALDAQAGFLDGNAEALNTAANVSEQL